MARKVISTPSTQFDASSAAHAKALLANADILAGDATSKAIMLLYGMIDDLIGNDTASNTAIALNTAKVDLTVDGAGTVHANNYTDTNTQLTIGTGSGNAKAGNTTTITSGQASAITANTAKTGITSTQAGHITANNAKVGFVTTMPTATEKHTVSLSVTNNRGTYALVITMTDEIKRVTKTATIALS